MTFSALYHEAVLGRLSLDDEDRGGEMPITKISRVILITLIIFVFTTGRVHPFELLFKARIDYPVGSGPQSVFSIDLDGDGDNDLAVANLDSENVSILLNNGDGTFAEAVNYGAGY
ncbi:MAG: FG-GAP-like repeat-containing protein, partial [Candidatus Zixiibacteriota bacterium]